MLGFKNLTCLKGKLSINQRSSSIFYGLLPMHLCIVNKTSN